MRSLEIHPPILAYFCNHTGRKLLPELQDFASFADPKIQAHDALNVLQSFRHRDKFFMLVFFSATHFPYAPPYPYYLTFTDPAYKGNYKYSKANLINVKEEITPEDKAQMKNIFEGGIRATDDAIGEILDYLKQNGMAENTIVIFNADHGENMYEYEYGMGHGEHLRGHYVLRFPWVIYDPRKSFAVKRVASQVRSIDYMPTALALLGLTPPQGIPGASLMPLLEGKTKDMQLPVYAETGLWFIHEGPEFFQKLRLAYSDVTRICDYEKYFHDEIVLKDEYNQYTEVAKYRMVMDDGWKLIYMPLPNGVRWELYNLKQDPEEQKDVSSDEPAQLEVMKKKLQAILLTRPGWTIDHDYFLPVSDQ
jgi:arylsulfatase A-like enzyme